MRAHQQPRHPPPTTTLLIAGQLAVQCAVTRLPACPPPTATPSPLRWSFFLGRLDVFYELGLGGCWDLCAGVLVLEEAGGRVLDPTGASALPPAFPLCLRLGLVRQMHAGVAKGSSKRMAQAQ